MENSDPVVIVGAARTPIGGFLGTFANLRAVDLGASAIQAAISRSTLQPSDISEVIFGCVLSAGVGQAPGRQAAIFAGVPNSVPCSTVNKVCGSGMKAVMLAHDLLLQQDHGILLTGGMESMSNAPYLLNKARTGYRFGSVAMLDAMQVDGLEDAYTKGTSMGLLAENLAEQYNFSRENQDEFALSSLERARNATENGWFMTQYEIAPVTITQPKAEPMIVTEDEHPKKVNVQKIPTLKPSFKTNGTITPANASPISDGAAALVLMRLSEATKRGLKPIAKILGHNSFSQDPNWYTTAPINAIKGLLKQLNWTTDTPDLYEINEAFAVVVLAAMKDLNLAHEKVNILGGACALGHPIGASGARIICTLLSALAHKNKKFGVAAVCIGGGEATAIAVERI